MALPDIDPRVVSLQEFAPGYQYYVIAENKSFSRILGCAMTFSEKGFGRCVVAEYCNKKWSLHTGSFTTWTKETAKKKLVEQLKTALILIEPIGAGRDASQDRLIKILKYSGIKDVSKPESAAWLKMIALALDELEHLSMEDK